MGELCPHGFSVSAKMHCVACMLQVDLTAARAEIERLKADAAREDAEGDRMLNERDEEISRLTLERDAAIRQAEHRHELQRTARQATLSECIRALEKLKEQP